MLQDNNLGITLLESTDLINYTQLSYDKATNQVIPTPCP